MRILLSMRKNKVWALLFRNYVLMFAGILQIREFILKDNVEISGHKISQDISYSSIMLQVHINFSLLRASYLYIYHTLIYLILII